MKRIATAVSLLLLASSAHAHDKPREPSEVGSLVTTTPLGSGNLGLSLGGGVAVLLPFYGFEAGVGLTDRIDLVGRFESVIGVFHYPSVGARFALAQLGRWRIGTSLRAAYSFFGIKTDQVNFTSTFYFIPEVGISGPVTKATELLFSLSSEVDVFEYRVVDDDGSVDAALRYDATIVRAGLQTKLTHDLNGYALARLRIPTETFVFEAREFYVIPMLEIGGTFTF